MLPSPPMPTAPAAVVDALNSLLEANQNSIIRFMGEGSPYLTRATIELRGQLQQMLNANLRRSRDLHELVDALGGEPRMLGVAPEEQYLAYLSLKFLLPKLVEAKELIIRRYENAQKAIGKLSPEATALLDRHLAQHHAELATLQAATQNVLAAK
jgi:hypothetical protein